MVFKFNFYDDLIFILLGLVNKNLKKKYNKENKKHFRIK